MTASSECDMGKDKIRHLIFMGRRWRYKPSKDMKPHGFRFTTLSAGVVIAGKNYPSAQDKTRAIGWNAEWDQIRCGETTSRPRWPTGSVGEAYDRALRLRAATRVTKGQRQTKDQESRDDWLRAWKWLEPVFGDVDPATIETEHFLRLEPVSGLAKGLIPKIEAAVSATERHRVIKVWRALWVRMEAMGYTHGKKDPSLAIANSTAPPRQAVWTEGEVVRLCKRAWRMGYKGLAACMATAWDSQLSPIDLRSLTTGQRSDDLQGAIFALARAKTNRAAAGSLGKRATYLLDAYIASLPFELMPNAPIFRTRGSATTAKGGKPQQPAPYTKNKLGFDFRVVRTAEFGLLETRQLADMRRSGTVEATAGGASAQAISTKMANTLATSTRLQQTYNPVNVVTVRDVDSHRREGRAKLRKNKPGRKV
ncbi:MAG: hypothetical protein GY873_41025 [Bosea sp.]|uniref:hypothetical protein n=1 Tax=Bosea sp. (in: a-proteobacteria) TaxID=1871050 RepID=UPI0023984268|nr:hypothetical protein [Bosea sp. (in: a-proteobacteria)]MCP4740583.1 hypothetical protein [Bosea sp. (in: a-proteobacteria)]